MKDASYLLHSPAAKQWQKISTQPHHGIAIPLFSLHSAQSSGIGEYPDLLPLIDWCVSIGFDVIQLLPVNDTGQGISPYSALSAFALHPQYIGLHALPHIEKKQVLVEELRAMPTFPQSTKVEYERVREHKEKFLRHYYSFFGEDILTSEAYQTFRQKADFWLKGYAAYKILKQKAGGSSWEVWTSEQRNPNEHFIDAICAEHKDEFQWYCFLQFLCDQQMQAACAYASLKKVFLMGDIPILIDRDSADVWLHQNLFNLEYSAGAPPDMYAEEGQNWGFPIYDWKNMAEEGYTWWKKRLQWATNYYHIYRIDHIVGFFRIWAIRYGDSGKNGAFIPDDESTWIDHGQQIMLMMLDACDMLPIGEDLGAVPPEVRECLSALGICGTRVMRWERKWKEDGQYISPENYPIDALTTVSTHDSETLPHWWKHYAIEGQLFASFKGWTYQPVLSREYMREILWDSHHSASLFHINPVQEYFCLLPGFSWSDPENERINIPGVFADHNWRYRLRPSLEELTQQTTLKHIIKELIE